MHFRWTETSETGQNVVPDTSLNHIIPWMWHWSLLVHLLFLPLVGSLPIQWLWCSWLPIRCPSCREAGAWACSWIFSFLKAAFCPPPPQQFCFPDALKLFFLSGKICFPELYSQRAEHCVMRAMVFHTGWHPFLGTAASSVVVLSLVLNSPCLSKQLPLIENQGNFAVRNQK